MPKRPHLDEPSIRASLTLLQRQQKWLGRIAERRKVYPSAVVRDAIDVYRAIVLSYGKQPLPGIKQLCIIIRAALTAYLAQQRADTPSADVAPPMEAPHDEG